VRAEEARGSTLGYNTRMSVTGVISIPSMHSVAASIDRLEGLLKEHGVMIFARIDFAADAGRAGLQLRPQQLLIFGNPKGGTPLMVAQPTVGLDLPLKVLAWEDASGKTFLCYNDPSYIVARHGLEGTLQMNLAAVTPLIAQAAQ
jgi:uncharacterized protein (DUF302 family)